MTRAALCGLLALASFALMASLVRPLVPLPEDHDLPRRVARVADRDSPVDLVFLGPSTVRCGFDPAVIDAELARAGHPVRSLNLGLPGASLYETDHLLERVLAEGGSRLRLIVIEIHADPPEAWIRPRNAFTSRAVWWHTPRQLRDVLAALSRGGAQAPVALGWLHVQHAAWRFTNLGQGDRILADLASGGPEPIGAGMGFLSERCTRGERQERAHRQFLETLGRYQREVAGLDAGNAREVATDHFDRAKLRRQVRAVRAAGAEPIYVLTPIAQPAPALRALQREGVLPTLLAFNSPARHPELYAPENRHDRLHLNARGAELFSRAFARRLARHLDEDG